MGEWTLMAPEEVLCAVAEGRNARNRLKKKKKESESGSGRQRWAGRMFANVFSSFPPPFKKICLCITILLAGALRSSLRHLSSLLSLRCPPPLAGLAGSR